MPASGRRELGAQPHLIEDYGAGTIWMMVR